VDMIIHQAVCPYNNTISIASALNIIQICNTILIRKKHVKPTIPTLNDVVGKMWGYYPG
jgi:hypothetical protein